MASDPTENVEPDSFALEVTPLEPRGPTDERSIKTVEDLDRALAGSQAASQLVIGVTAIDSEGGDMGSFWLFLNGDRGWIHLIDGPCFTARDPLTAETSDAAIEFQDEAGFTHHRPLHDTVSREQGFAAIRHWMPHGDRLSGLQWFDEERDTA